MIKGWADRPLNTPRPRFFPEHKGHVQLSDETSPDSEVSRGGRPQHLPVLFHFGRQLLQPGILPVQFLQPFRLICLHTAALPAPPGIPSGRLR